MIRLRAVTYILVQNKTKICKVFPWNARSLITNKAELSHFLSKQQQLPELINFAFKRHTSKAITVSNLWDITLSAQTGEMAREERCHHNKRGFTLYSVRKPNIFRVCGYQSHYGKK